MPVGSSVSSSIIHGSFAKFATAHPSVKNCPPIYVSYPSIAIAFTEENVSRGEVNVGSTNPVDVKRTIAFLAIHQILLNCHQITAFPSDCIATDNTLRSLEFGSYPASTNHVLDKRAIPFLDTPQIVSNTPTITIFPSGCRANARLFSAPIGAANVASRKPVFVIRAIPFTDAHHTVVNIPCIRIFPSGWVFILDIYPSRFALNVVSSKPVLVKRARPVLVPPAIVESQKPPTSIFPSDCTMISVIDHTGPAIFALNVVSTNPVSVTRARKFLDVLSTVVNPPPRSIFPSGWTAIA